MNSVKKINLILIAILVFTSFAYIIQASGIVAKGGEISELNQEIAQLKSENGEYQAEVAVLASPQRLAEISEEMGLEENNEMVYIQLAPAGFTLNQ